MQAADTGEKQCTPYALVAERQQRIAIITQLLAVVQAFALGERVPAFVFCRATAVAGNAADARPGQQSSTVQP